MKNLFNKAIVVGVLAIAFFPFTSEAALSDSLVSYWAFEGNSTDSHGSNDGTDANISYNASFGKVGQGIDCNGTTSDIDLGSDASLNITSSMTLNAWIDLDDKNSYRRFIAKGSETGTVDTQYAMMYHQALNKWYVYTSDRTVTYSDAYSLAVNINEWHMVTMVFNGSNVIIYVDGANKVTGSAIAALNSSANNLSFCNDSAGANFANGQMDEVGLWNRALSDAEVSQLYNSGSGLTYADIAPATPAPVFRPQMFF